MRYLCFRQEFHNKLVVFELSHYLYPELLEDGVCLARFFGRLLLPDLGLLAIVFGHPYNRFDGFLLFY